MTCRKIRLLMPLFAGDDLGPRRTQAVRAHVDACPACRRELEELRAALIRFKAAARDESVPDWNEGEWKALMVRATVGAEKWAWAGSALRPSGAAASALGALIGLAVLSASDAQVIWAGQRVLLMNGNKVLADITADNRAVAKIKVWCLKNAWRCSAVRDGRIWL